MPRLFNVTIVAKVSHTLEVEADGYEDAVDRASRRFESIAQQMTGYVYDQEIDEVELSGPED